jgi:hypothetical protein
LNFRDYWHFILTKNQTYLTAEPVRRCVGYYEQQADQS